MTIKDEANMQRDSYPAEQNPADPGRTAVPASKTGDPVWHILAEFNLQNETSSENLAKKGAAAVIEAVSILHLPATRLAGLKAAVEKAALNAVEHRDRSHPELPIALRIYAPGRAGPHGIEKLDRTVRGWGYFFIEKLTETGTGETHPVVELYFYQEGSI